MTLDVSIVAAGAMGAAMGGRLRERGCTVRTCLDGRSRATRERAAAHGMEDVAFARLFEADLFLSVVPPGEAVALAQAAAPYLRGRAAYVDCNAINPATAARVGTIVARAGGTTIDASIIGGPPAPGQVGPVLYAAGPDRDRLLPLNEHGLRVRDLGPGIGDASAFKMAYGGITKGMTALAAVQMLAATRAGVGAALHAELAESQPEFLAWFSRQVPGMIPKAYRWVAEMEEVAGFLTEDPAGADAYAAIARFYAAIAEDAAGGGKDAATLKTFFAREA